MGGLFSPAYRLSPLSSKPPNFLDMSFHPTQPLLANGHQAQSVVEAEATADALRLKISVLETMLAKSVVREMENRLGMESLKRTHEAERTRLGNANAKLLREFASTHPKIRPLTRPNFPQMLFCG
jgi:hypothetical protein